MATPTCIKCGGTSFELKEPRNIKNAAYRHHFIQCSSCGGVVGVVPFYDTSDLIGKLAKRLGIRRFFE